MAKIWVAEKFSLAQAVGAVIGPGEIPWLDEKACKAQQYNQVGDNIFFWLDGHALELAMPDAYMSDDVPVTSKGTKVWRLQDLPVIPQTWQMIPKENKKRRLSLLVNALKTASEVYHLGDMDEEGQVLVDEALRYCRYSGHAKRVLVNDQNPTKIREALANIRNNDEPLFRGWYKSGKARSQYDWLFGLNLTMAMTARAKELGHNALLPVGSLQTPLLYIVRQRDAAIENFKAVPYYSISADVQHAKGSFRARWVPGPNQAGLDSEKRLIDQSVANAISSKVSGKPGEISKADVTHKVVRPPLLLGQDELQMQAFAQFGYDGMQVMQAAQKLYEVYKVATYPRSTVRYLSMAQHSEAPAVIQKILSLRPDLEQLRNDLDPSRISPSFNDKALSGQPHHGIVPAIPEVSVDPSSWSEIERNVYDLIVKSYLAQFAADYEYLATKIEITVEGETFAASGSTPVLSGWKAIYVEASDKPKTGEAEEDTQPSLPPVSQSDRVIVKACSSTPKKTTPPDRFDEAALTRAMKNIYEHVDDPAAKKRLKDGDGIGTSATRAPMVADLKERALLIPVKEGSKKLMTSPVARALIDALLYSVKSPGQAGIYKMQLDQIAKGELPVDSFLGATTAWLNDVINEIRQTTLSLPRPEGIDCPQCKTGQLRSKKNDKGTFWYCSNWNAEPACTVRFPDLNGKPLTASHACPTCKSGQLRRKDGKYGPFWYCSNWNAELACSARFPDIKGAPNLEPPPQCPTCREGHLRQIKGPNGKFWGCSRFNDGCKAAFPDKSGKPDTSPPPTCPTCKVGLLQKRKGTYGDFWGCNRYKEGCKASFPDKRGKPDFTPRKPRS